MEDSLDMAYKYPFSEEAKSVIAEKGPKSIEYKYLELGKSRLEAALSGKQSFFEMKLDNIKLSYVISYIYARMLASASGNESIIRAFASGEAKRSGMALANEPKSVLLRLAKQFSFNMMSSKEEEFIISLSEYLQKKPNGERYTLVNMKLKDGNIMLSKEELQRILEHSIYIKVLSGLPLPKGQLPKEIIDYYSSSKIKLPQSKLKHTATSQESAWIENVLATPIPDVRHRAVNLVLAPYLVNVKGMSVEDATSAIMKYIDECKRINPNTDVSEVYIRYQCNYAKNKGMRPLSISKAKELLGEYVDFGEFNESKKIEKKATK